MSTWDITDPELTEAVIKAIAMNPTQGLLSVITNMDGFMKFGMEHEDGSGGFGNTEHPRLSYFYHFDTYAHSVAAHQAVQIWHYSSPLSQKMTLADTITGFILGDISAQLTFHTSNTHE